jgi:hypothetical protein
MLLVLLLSAAVLLVLLLSAAVLLVLLQICRGASPRGPARLPLLPRRACRARMTSEARQSSDAAREARTTRKIESSQSHLRLFADRRPGSLGPTWLRTHCF